MIYVVYGVTASGKTTISNLLANKLKISFYDADDFHSSSNLKKLKEGIPLKDSDRRPWLQSLRKEIKTWEKKGGAVIACSALKESYRSILMGDMKIPIQFILLQAPMLILKRRLESRKNHFISPSLLNSQLKDLEIASYGIRVNSNMQPKEVVQSILSHLINKSHVGIIGMGAMGKNLSLNISSKGYLTSIYNRELKDKEKNVADDFAKMNKKFKLLPFNKLPEFIKSLELPRKIFLMISSGDPTDEVLSKLMMLLDPGDIVIDLGNSYFIDSQRRAQFLNQRKIHFLGIGVSGGIKGVRNGSSFMASGAPDVYAQISPLLEKISASDYKGNPCCSYLGPDGSGHYVKTIHNGIEYAEMQLIAELYHLMRVHLDMRIDQISNLFKEWNKNDISSYLLEITAIILDTEKDGVPIIDLIDDKANNKGTGAWSIIGSLEAGRPLDTISSALMFRYISSMSKQRKKANNSYKILKGKGLIDKKTIKSAYQAARIINHGLAFNLLQEASIKYGWDLNLSEIARVWTNGCIIRSKLMIDWVNLLKKGSSEHPLLHQKIVKELKFLHPSLSQLVSGALNINCGMNTHSSALNFFLSFTCELLPSNLIQAQRDFFGMHGIKFIDGNESQEINYEW